MVTTDSNIKGQLNTIIINYITTVYQQLYINSDKIYM